MVVCRKVLVAKESHWSTYSSGRFAQRFAENPQLIELVETGRHLASERGELASKVFKDRCEQIMKDKIYRYSAYYYGVQYLEVLEVSGRYRIIEADDGEMIETEDSVEWWT